MVGMFDNDPDGERQRAYREKRRNAAEDRYMDKLERLMKEAEPLIGELVREGRTLFYVNVRSKAGHLTGAIREFARSVDASDYLIRNNYV
jgi:hypothetical protein